MASSSQQRETKMRNISTEPIVEKETALQPAYVPSVTSALTIQNDKHKEREQKIKLPPTEDINKVITKSTLADADSMKQAEKIKQKFNEGIQQSAFAQPSLFTASGMRGEFLERDEFMLASRNRVAELATFNKDYNTATIMKSDGTEIIKHGRVKHYDLFFGHDGSYVLNVPQDKFAKAMSGQKPLLFGPGPHVIKDANFRFDSKKGFINQSESVISHGNLHVILVPRGFIAKIWIGTEPYILEHNEEPYVFNSPQFKIDKNGDDFFFSASDWVIQHGTITKLRVPAGNIAKAWDETKPLLLNARDVPYYYDSPTFKLEITNNNYFVSSDEKLITHGSLKRILPSINNVAVVSNGGNLIIIEPNKDGSPTVINSPTQKVEGFLDKTIQTVTFPSKATIEQRKKENKEHPHMEIFRTRDNLEVGVTLLVGYQIVDAEKAMALGLNGIEKHIEHVANVDMNKAISQSSLGDIVTSYQTKPHKDQLLPGSYGLQTVQPMQHYQDIVKKQLGDDLREWGIELIRLNIESPNIINKEIARKMEKQGESSAEANAKEAILSQQANIEVAQAKREAAIKDVAQGQANQALISAAQAKLDAAKLEAEAMRIRAIAEAEAIVMKAKAEQEAAALKGEIYQRYPELLQKDMVDRMMLTEEKRPIYPPSAGSVFPADYFSQFRAPGMFSAAQPGLPSLPEASKVVRLPVAPEGKV